jgi:hypothetical protein
MTSELDEEQKRPTNMDFGKNRINNYVRIQLSLSRYICSFYERFS